MEEVRHELNRDLVCTLPSAIPPARLSLSYSQPSSLFVSTPPLWRSRRCVSFRCILQPALTNDACMKIAVCLVPFGEQIRWQGLVEGLS